MSKIKTGTTLTTAYQVEGDTTGALVIQTGSTPTTAVTIGADQSTTLAGTLSVTGNTAMTGYLNAPNTFGFKNRILNGGMVIDQRNGGASVTPASSTYLVDRYQAVLSVASKLTFQQVSDAPAGFSNSLKVTVASQYSPSTSEQFVVRQAIEGFNAADLGLGTASATTITVSAWVKSSVAGTYALYLANGASDRGYVSTVSVTTSWTQVSFTLTGDTAGTWLTNNGIGLYLGIDLGCGSAFKAPSNNSWQAGDYKSATGAVVFVNQTSTTSTFQITGVQLEKGSTATSFDFRSYGTELSLCQRYYLKVTDKRFSGSQNAGTDLNQFSMLFPVSMRASPTVAVDISPYSGDNNIGTPYASNVTVGGFAFTCNKPAAGYFYSKWDFTASIEL